MVAPVRRRSACTPIKSSATLLPPWIVDRVSLPVPALFPRFHLYLHIPAVPVDVHVHPVLECLLISECVIREIRRKRRLSPCVCMGLWVGLCGCQHNKKKTPDQNDLKLGMAVVLDTVSKPINFRLKFTVRVRVRVGVQDYGSGWH